MTHIARLRHEMHKINFKWVRSTWEHRLKVWNLKCKAAVVLMPWLWRLGPRPWVQRSAACEAWVLTLPHLNTPVPLLCHLGFLASTAQAPSHILISQGGLPKWGHARQAPRKPAWRGSAAIVLLRQVLEQVSQKQAADSPSSVSNCLHAVTDVQYSSFFRKKLTVCPACQLSLFSAWEVLAPLWMI